MPLPDIEQRSIEWRMSRVGRVTASRVADVIAKTKTGWGASRANYMAQLIAERLTGVPGDSYTNAAMQWGIDTEAEARAAYAFYADADVTECGFIPHPTIGMTGASPDGFAGNDGLVEIKCPNTASHLDTLLGQNIQGKYVTQMQWQMACTGRQWCDFVSYDPRLPERMRLFVQRVPRVDTDIRVLEKEIVAFLNELQDRLDKLNSIYGDAEPVNLLAAG